MGGRRRAGRERSRGRAAHVCAVAASHAHDEPFYENLPSRGSLATSMPVTTAYRMPRGMPRAGRDLVFDTGRSSEGRSRPGFRYRAVFRGAVAIGAHELFAEVLDDNPGALWKRPPIEKLRVRKLFFRGSRGSLLL